MFDVTRTVIPPMIHFRLLGAADVRQAETGERLKLSRRPMELAFVTSLLLSPGGGPVPRARLLPLLWPDADDAKARHSLRQLLYRVGKRLGGGIIQREGDTLRLAEDGFRCDVHEYEGHLDEGRLVEAVDLYRGHLLPGFHLESSTGFERWLDGRREELRVRALEALGTLAVRAEAAGDLDGALAWVRRSRELDPWGERGLRRHMELLQRSGRGGEALAEYEKLAERLREEFAVGPSRATEQAADAIRSAHPTPPAPSRAESSPTPPGTPAPPRAETAPPGGPEPRRPGVLLRRRRLLSAGLLAVLGIMVAAVVATAGDEAPPILSGWEGGDPPRLVVEPFEVAGLGDAAEVDPVALARIVATNLDGVGGYRTTVAGSGPGGVLPSSLDGASVLRGSLVGVGRRIRLDGSLHRGEGSTVVRASVTGPRSRVLELADRLSARIIVEMDARPTDSPLRDAAALSTGSLPALRRYLAGRRSQSRGDDEEALAHFQEAVDHDPDFALAHHGVATAAGSLRERVLALRAGEAAVRHATELPTVVREVVGTHLHLLRGEAREATLRARAVLELNPTLQEGWYLLGESLFYGGGAAAGSRGDALYAFHRAAELDPAHVPSLLYLTRLEAHQGDRGQVEELLGRIRRVGGHPTAIWEARALHAALSGSPDRKEWLLPRLARLDHYSLERITWSVSLFGDDPAWATELAGLLENDRHPPSSQAMAATWKAELDMAQGSFEVARRSLERLGRLDPRAALELQSVIMRRAGRAPTSATGLEALDTPAPGKLSHRLDLPHGTGPATPSHGRTR